MGGQSGSDSLNTCHELVNGTWVAKAPMAFARKDFAVAMVGESKIIVAGGKCDRVLGCLYVYIFAMDGQTARGIFMKL